MHAFPLLNLDCITCINFPLIALGIYFWFNAEGLWFQCQNASVSSYECLKLFPVTRPAQGNLKNRQTRQPLLISWDGHTILLIHCIYLYPKRLISLIGWWDTFCTKDRIFENFITQANSKKNLSGCAWLWLSEKNGQNGFIWQRCTVPELLILLNSKTLSSFTLTFFHTKRIFCGHKKNHPSNNAHLCVCPDIVLH